MRNSIILHDLQTTDPILVYIDKIDVIRTHNVVSQMSGALYRKRDYVTVLVNGAVIQVEESFEKIQELIEEAEQ